jgi:hypothetical protein
MTPRPATVKVRFDQQQRKLLDFLRAERKFGTEDGEIIRNVSSVQQVARVRMGPSWS